MIFFGFLPLFGDLNIMCDCLQFLDMVKTVTSGGPGTWIKCDQTIQICTSLNGINCPHNVCYSETITSRTDQNKFGNNIHSDKRKQAAKNKGVRPRRNSTDFAAASVNDPENLFHIIPIF